MKEKAAAKGVKLLLPVDNVVADAFSDFEKLLSERLKNRKENEFFV